MAMFVTLPELVAEGAAVAETPPIVSACAGDPKAIAIARKSL